MSMIAANAQIEISAYRWVPEFAQGFVRDLRPRWACEEARIPYRERLADVTEKPDWLVEGQPWGQIPIIRDGEITVFESGATLLHLAEKSEALMPTGGQAAAETLSWLMAAFNTIEPPIFEHGNVTLFAKDEEWAKLRRPSLEEFISRRLAPIERLLAQREWLAGTFTVADIAMVTTLRPLSGSDVFEGCVALAAYVERGEARPAFVQGMADQMAAFAKHPDNKC